MSLEVIYIYIYIYIYVIDFYLFRDYRELTNTIACYFNQPSILNITDNVQYSILSPKTKRIYLLITVIFRVPIPFLLLLAMNIILFVSVSRTRQRSLHSTEKFLARHGHHRQVTPMIFFSTCILLLTLSPR